jgi:PAS domain S-box-containing protein
MLGIVFWDISGKVTEANKAFLKIAGYSEEAVLPENEFLNDVKPLEYILLNERALQEMAATGACLPFETEYLRKDGTRVPILLGAALLEGRKDRGFCFILDITQRRRAESERQVMFEIIQGVSSAESLDKLLHRIHQSLKRVIYAENCFILLYNKTTGMFDTTFFIDKFDRPFAPHQLGKSCTAYVFRTGQPLLLTQERFEQLVKEGEVELVGTNSPSWLGVPLKSATESIGVLVVQHYEDPNAYTQRDLEFLTSIGNEIALAIERKRTEEQLHIFAHAFEGTTELISLTDLDNRLVFVNKSFLQTYGCEEKEILGKGAEFFASPLNPPDIHKEILERTRLGSWSGELYNRKKDGADFPVSLNTSVIRDKEGKPIGYLGIAQDISERKHAEEQLKESYEQLRLLASRLQIIREEESMRIAREIHDDLGQALTGMKMDLSFFAEELSEQQGPGSKEKLIERINAMSSLVDGAITSMRKTITELRPAVLDSLGLAAAIEWQAEEFQRRTGTKCSYSYQIEGFQIDPHRSTAIFRILQESLTNVARHAQASKVSIVLKKESDAIVMDIQDNGKGISEEASHKVGSFGILGMKERVLPFGGSIDVRRLPGGGTTVAVRIPLA